MDTKISIYSQTESTSSDTGEMLRTWTSIGYYFAAIDYGSGSESVEADGIVNISNVNFTIHKDTTTIDTKMRVLYDNLYYDIINIEPVGRNRYLKLKCKKRV